MILVLAFAIINGVFAVFAASLGNPWVAAFSAFSSGFGIAVAWVIADREAA